MEFRKNLFYGVWSSKILKVCRTAKKTTMYLDIVSKTQHFVLKKEKREFLSLMFDEDFALYNLWGFKYSNVFTLELEESQECVFIRLDVSILIDNSRIFVMRNKDLRFAR